MIHSVGICVAELPSGMDVVLVVWCSIRRVEMSSSLLTNDPSKRILFYPVSCIAYTFYVKTF